ncbi:hypothetical protein LUZ61_018455 [Rhynchospora tenuis]|uniref:NAD(P)-binding protein n=1 Tax=Rhynchospora tenuis TaxID=198213 RepID=A0AAD5Z9G6_9POAL|nr:hypothetical protein LUZ61_018455 [Rhynchospora tenuis]
MASQPPPFPSNQPFVHLDSPTLNMLLSLDLLIHHLLTALPALLPSIHFVPHRVPSPSSSTTTSSSTSPASSPSPNAVFLKTCWSTNPSLPYLSVGMLTEFPSNSPLFPDKHYIVSLFHSPTGVPLASLDGAPIFFFSIAALSGLASFLLSLHSSKTLLIIGSVEKAYLITAHRIARPSINHIIVYNPNISQAVDFVLELISREPASSSVTFDYAKNLDDVIGLADIVCCALCEATNSPIVKGSLLKPGAHLDLVGSLASEMKECDDDALSRGRVFVDEVAMDAAGTFVNFVNFAGTLTELAGVKKQGRKTNDEVTVFKTFGSTKVHLLVAQFAYESYIKLSNL